MLEAELQFFQEANKEVDVGTALIFVPLIFGVILILNVISLGDKHHVLKIFFSMLSYLMIIPTLWLAGLSVVKYEVGWTDMVDALGNLTNWLGMLFFAIVIYWLIYGFYTMVHSMAQKKGEDAEVKYQ